MKVSILILAFLICCFLSGGAQNKTELPKRFYRTWVSLKSDQPRVVGLLYETRDSTILVSNSLTKADYITGTFNIEEINFRDIKTITTRHYNGSGRGAIIGGITGLAIGGLMYIGSMDQVQTNELNPFSGGFGPGVMLVGAFEGACYGALIGSFRVGIPIDGNFGEFKRNRWILRRKSFKKTVEYPEK